MHVFLYELAILSIAVLSSGFFFRERLAEWRVLEIVVGFVAVITMLEAVFGVYAKAATWAQQLSEEYEKSSQIAREVARENRVKALRGLQKELSRLGCYHGPLDGVWGLQSQQALSDFLKAHGDQSYDGVSSITIEDAQQLFAAAPNGVCLTSRAV